MRSVSHDGLAEQFVESRRVSVSLARPLLATTRSLPHAAQSERFPSGAASAPRFLGVSPLRTMSHHGPREVEQPRASETLTLRFINRLFVRSSEPRLASTAQGGRKGTDHERQNFHHTVIRSQQPAAVGWLCSRSRLLGRTRHGAMQSATALCLALRSRRLLDQQKWLRERRLQSASVRLFDELWSAR